MSEPAAAGESRNEVVLTGWVSEPPQERVRSDGTTIVTFKVDVLRDPDASTARDTFECTARSARLRRSLTAWHAGDVVEITGALRRRFYRVGERSRPFTVVEVERARRLSSAVSRRRTSG